MIEILNEIKNFFTKQKVEDSANDKFEEIKNKANTIKTIYGKQSSAFDSRYQYIIDGGDEEAKRREYMTSNMDELLKEIKKEITKQPLLSRVIRNICTGALKDEFEFKGKNSRNKEKEKLVKEKFYEIMSNSSYLDNEFLEEILYNLIKYSNAFILPKRNENEKIEKATVIQNSGWTVDKKIGSCYAETFRFKYNANMLENSVGKVFRNEINIWHYTFGRESDEIFGMPIWVSVIPFLRKYNFLISSSIDSYSDQSLEKTIYEIGVLPNGNIRAVTPEAYNSIVSQLQNNTEEDLITDVPVKTTTISKTFNSPDKTLEALTLQVIAGLYTSESQLGKNGAGRQDAETQQDSTNLIISDFQKNLERHLNKTLIREICKDLFGNNLGENDIRMEFNKSFNDSEREDKHTVFKFQGGVIDLTEARHEMGYMDEITSSKSFFELYQQKEMEGSVASKNSPSNQHTKGTGTTKPTKKN